MEWSFDVRYEDVYFGWCREVAWDRSDDNLWAMIDGPEDRYSVAVDSLKTRPHLPGCIREDDATSEQRDHIYVWIDAVSKQQRFPSLCLCFSSRKT